MTQPITHSSDRDVLNLNEPESSRAALVSLARQHLAPGLIVQPVPAQAATSPDFEELASAGFSFARVEFPPVPKPTAHYTYNGNGNGKVENYALPPASAYYVSGTLEFLEEPQAWLAAISGQAQHNGTKALLLEVPNVAHWLNAASLLSGQGLSADWEGQRQFFTTSRLLELLEQSGWQLVERCDVKLAAPNNAPPSLLHSTDTLAGDWLHLLGQTLNPASEIERFVWLLRPMEQGQPPANKESDEVAALSPLFSVLVRTQGTRNELLIEALYSVYAQECDDYELIVCFHNLKADRASLLVALREVLESLPPLLTDKLRLIECQGQGRTAPLNALLEASKGQHVTFLDDDDLLFPNHLSTIQAGITYHGPGHIFQTFAARRMVQVLSEQPQATFPYAVTDIQSYWTLPFDPVRQQYNNQVPITNYILPRSLIEQAGLRFRTDFDLGEDWELLIRSAQLLRVITLPQLTSAINIRDNGTGTVHGSDTLGAWAKATKQQIDLRAQRPALLEGRAIHSLEKWSQEDWRRSLYYADQMAFLQADLEQERLEKKLLIARQQFEELRAWAQKLNQTLARLDRSRFYRVLSRVRPEPPTPSSPELEVLEARKAAHKDIVAYRTSQNPLARELGEKLAEYEELNEWAQSLNHRLSSLQGRPIYRLLRRLPWLP